MKKKFSLNIALITAAIFFIYLIWDKVISFINGTPLKRLNTIGATLNDTQALEQSESLYLAMNSYGTDEQVIYDVLKDISLPNFNKIYNAFGKKYYDAQIGINGNFILDFDLDLLGWINSELTEKELEKLRLLSPNVFL